MIDHIRRLLKFVGLFFKTSRLSFVTPTILGFKIRCVEEAVERQEERTGIGNQNSGQSTQ